MAPEQRRSTVGDYVTLQRGTTYDGMSVGKPGPALLGLGSIEPGGGFREDGYKTYGGECPPNLMLSPGDLYVALKGATKDGKMIGSVARVPPTVPSGRLTQDTVKLEFKAPDPGEVSYIYWLLRTPQYREYCAAHAMGSAVVALGRGDFLNYQVPLLNVARMDLVALFDAIEQKVMLNRQINRTVEIVVRALFKSWFIDFDPVRAKVEGRVPAGMDAATAALFPSKLHKTELGEIPVGWDVLPLGDVMRLKRGYDLPAGKRIPGNIPIVSSSGVTGRHNESKVVGPGVVTGRYGTIGQVFLIWEDFWPLNTTLYLQDSKGNNLIYCYYLLSRVDFMKFSDKAAVPGINRNHLHEEYVVRAPVPIQECFEAVVGTWLELVRRNHKQMTVLTALRDSLLPRLLSGEISVPNAEQIVAKGAS